MTLLARLPANPGRGTAELLERCVDLMEQNTTAVLFTPGPVEVAVTDRLRGQLVSLAAGSPQARTWFRFPDETDFNELCAGRPGGGRTVSWELGVMSWELKQMLPTTDSQPPTPNSQLPTPNSRLPTPDSRLPTPDSRLPTPNSQLPTPNSQLRCTTSASSSPPCTWSSCSA